MTLNERLRSRTECAAGLTLNLEQHWDWFIKSYLYKLFSPTGTGQVSAPICCLMTLRRPVFLVNSRPRLFFATRRYPFSLSYEVILPSSLERVISRPLVFSTYPPVSDWYRYTFLLLWKEIKLELFLKENSLHSNNKDSRVLSLTHRLRFSVLP